MWNFSWEFVATLVAFCISSSIIFRLWALHSNSKKPKLQNTDDDSQFQLTPEKWVKVGRVKKLIIYPIKSCSGTVVDKAIITTLGLKFQHANIRDRDFMVVDENGKQVTMTKYPRMCLIKVEVNSNDTLTVHGPDMPTLTFTYPEDNEQNERLCRVKKDSHIKALDCGDEVAQWFKEFLDDSTLRVYYHHLNKTQRTFEPYMFKCKQFEQSDMGTFHNETSYLLVSEESINDLNTRLEKNSSWENWRPTILIDQVMEPFAEINWSFIRIGDRNGILKATVPCYRCPMTTVDQNLGVLPKDGEPLRTLRMMNIGDRVSDKQVQEVLKNKGVMGLRLGLYLPAGEGTIISAGEPVYAALL